MEMDVVGMINKYGFPVIAAFGMGYLIYYVWRWVTTEIRPTLKETETIMVALADRVRLLDNDLIRLNQKVDVVLQLRGKLIEREKMLAEKRINDEKKLIEQQPN